MQELETLKQWIADSKHIVFFGGAGVSTESGIPDFRSVDGLYSQKFEYLPEEIISRNFLENKSEYFFSFYKEKMMPMGYLPNVTHLYLAELEKKGVLSAVITQNIDGLHQQAGSKTVYELHGSIDKNYCMICGKRYSAAFVKESAGVPRCTCGGTVRPDVVLYGERLNNETVELAAEAIENADMLIVGGTSLTVYPAAGLIRYYHGDRLVLINRDETPYDSMADLVIHDSLGTVFSKIS